MPGDGVSLPTTLAQMGSVAKTQAKVQQHAPQVTPFSELKDETEELKVQRVKETAEAEKNRVTGDGEDTDKRKRRRLKRNRKRWREDKEDLREKLEAGAGEDPDGGQAETETEPLGSLIDLRV